MVIGRLLSDHRRCILCCLCVRHMRRSFIPSNTSATRAEPVLGATVSPRAPDVPECCFRIDLGPVYRMAEEGWRTSGRGERSGRSEFAFRGRGT
jgi:hypothetical protein